MVVVGAYVKHVVYYGWGRFHVASCLVNPFFGSCGSVEAVDAVVFGAHVHVAVCHRWGRSNPVPSWALPNSCASRGIKAVDVVVFRAKVDAAVSRRRAKKRRCPESGMSRFGSPVKHSNSKRCRRMNQRRGSRCIGWAKKWCFQWGLPQHFSRGRVDCEDVKVVR